MDNLPKFIRRRMAGQQQERVLVSRASLVPLFTSIDQNRYEDDLLYRTAVDTLVAVTDRQQGPALRLNRARLVEVFGSEKTKAMILSETLPAKD